MLAAAGAPAALAFGPSARGARAARFDVIFDDARGLVAGQLVKIAGAKAGTIRTWSSRPTSRRGSRPAIESQFMPFHQNATCTIRPEGLIAENYVDCDPGTAGQPAAAGRAAAHPPTVPVANTTEPVSLLDLFNIFNLPTRERLAVIVNELGVAHRRRGATTSTTCCGAPTVAGAGAPGDRDPRPPARAAGHDRRRHQHDRRRRRRAHRPASRTSSTVPRR